MLATVAAIYLYAVGAAVTYFGVAGDRDLTLLGKAGSIVAWPFVVPYYVAREWLEDARR